MNFSGDSCERTSIRNSGRSNTEHDKARPCALHAVQNGRMVRARALCDGRNASRGSWFHRNPGETFAVIVRRDEGRSMVADQIQDPSGRDSQLEFERSWYAPAPADWSVVEVGLLVAPEAEAE